VETALLGCGLPSLKDELLLYLWPAAPQAELLWMEKGRLQVGSLPLFLEIRGKNWPRLNAREMAGAAARRGDGFLTASALLRVAAALPGEKRRIVVISGMGGIRQGIISADLQELSRSPDLLLSSGFKDSLEMEPSLAFLREKGVRLLGWQCEHLDGFLFHESPCLLDGSLKKEAEADLIFSRNKGGKSIVLFNPLPPSLRLKDRKILASAVKHGDKARREGYDFHPAVNRALDRSSNGCSSLFQLLALIANIQLACRLLHSNFEHNNINIKRER